MRIAFAGTPAFAVPSLRALVDSAHEVVCLITQPDRPAGRGLSLKPPPVKKIAEECGLQVYQPLKFNKSEFLDQLEGLGLELIVTVAYGKIFRARSLHIPSKGCVNVHASLLPLYRGVAPINWAIINGETETGVTTFFMEAGVDTGEVIVQKKTAIDEDETAGEVHDRLAVMGAEVIVETCDLIEGDVAPRVRQDDSRASYAPKLSKEDAEIAWNRPALDVHNHIRGVNPRPGAYALFRGSPVRILRSRMGPDSTSGYEHAHPPGGETGQRPGGGAGAGRVLDIDAGNGILIECSRGSVWLREVQAAGRRALDGAAFSRGARLARGDFFA